MLPPNDHWCPGRGKWFFVGLPAQAEAKPAASEQFPKRAARPPGLADYSERSLEDFVFAAEAAAETPLEISL